MKLLAFVFVLQCLVWETILSQIIFQEDDASTPAQLTSAKPLVPQPTSISITSTTTESLDLNQKEGPGTNATRLQNINGTNAKAPAPTVAPTFSPISSTSSLGIQELSSSRKSESFDGNRLRVPGTDLPCGISSVPQQRIVGGREALPGEWPWMAAIGYGYDDEEGFLFRFKCGGALISEQHVLTAAHCIAQGLEPRGVRLGDHNLYDKHDGADHQEAFIERVVKHPRFDPRTFENDIAVLKLRSKVTFASNIQPICLPFGLQFRNATFENPSPSIAGWGRIEWQGRPSAILQKAQVPIVDVRTCADKYRKLKEQIFETNICAGYLTTGGIDACEGDSGGPLMYPEVSGKNSQFVAIGVISNGHKCAEPGYPGVYTRVSSYTDWIQEVMTAM